MAEKMTNTNTKQWRNQRLFCISEQDSINDRIWLHSEAPMEVHILLKSVSNGNGPEKIVNKSVSYSISKELNQQELVSTLLSFEMIQRTVDLDKTIKLLQQ